MTSPQPREIRIATARIELAARHWGNEHGEPVLAVHGWLDNAASFDPLLVQLDLDRYQVVALDLPGHGLSAHRPPGESYHLLEYVRDIIAAADYLGWNSFRLLGHSLGGALCMLVASAYPERVLQLMLLDALGPLAAVEKEGPESLRKAIDKSLQGSGAMPVYESIAKAVEARQRGVGRLSAEAAELIAARNLKRESGGWEWRTDPRLRWPSLQRLSETQVRAYLAAIRCPTLLIAGRQGMIKPDQPAVHDRLSCIAGLDIHYVDGGHHLHMEPDPSRIAGLLMAFCSAPGSGEGGAISAG